METMQGLHRTHGCGTISEQEVGKEVVLCGWVERRRDHGGLIFLDLRDRSGVVQVVASPDHNVESFHKAEDVRNEYVLCVRGKITNVMKLLSIQIFQQVHMKCTVKSCAY